MAAPNDPPGAGSPAAFAGARITPDEAERLAAQFRPSWEFDEAPVADAGALSEEAIRALRRSGTQADVRGAMAALNGSHAPSPSSILAEPSVIVDESANEAAAAPLGHASAATQGASVGSRAGRSSRLATTTVIIPHKRKAPAFLDLRNISKRPHFGLWLGLTAAAFTLIVVGVWLVSGPDDKRDARTEPSAAQPVAAPPAAVAKPVDAPGATANPPAPPTVTALAPPAPDTAATPAPPPVAAPPIQARAEAPSPSPVFVPTPRPAAAIVSPPPPARIAVAPASPPAWVAAPPQAPPSRAPLAIQAPRPPTPSIPAPRSPARPKTPTTTIVHEVPF
jgi:hypothetical protein